MQVSVHTPAANYRAIFDAANDAIFVHDIRTGAILDVNHKMTEMYGYTVEEARRLNVEALSAGVPPYTQQDAVHRLGLALKGEPQIFEWMAKDKNGRHFWVEVNIKRAIIGEEARLLAIVRDIGERKRNEAALRRSQSELRALAGRLISAKEEENRRLARELHDVFSQRLAVLALELAAVEHASTNSIKESVQRMGTEVGRLASDVHQLSLELHPSVIDDLGLFAVLRAECAKFAKQHRISARFSAAEMEDSFPVEVSLNLYRIAQEALWNIAKHARAQNVEISVSEGDGTVRLTIEDDGAGFDVSQAKEKDSLGLVSMEERARLLGGSFRVHSQPGKGTKVEVCIPVPQQGA